MAMHSVVPGVNRGIARKVAKRQTEPVVRPTTTCSAADGPQGGVAAKRASVEAHPLTVERGASLTVPPLSEERPL